MHCLHEQGLLVINNLHNSWYTYSLNIKTFEMSIILRPHAMTSSVNFLQNDDGL